MLCVFNLQRKIASRGLLFGQWKILLVLIHPHSPLSTLNFAIFFMASVDVLSKPHYTAMFNAKGGYDGMDGQLRFFIRCALRTAFF